MSYSKQLFVIPLLVILFGCSDGSDSKTQAKQQQDHIWKQQTKAIERAKAVEPMVLDSTKKRLDEIDQQAK